MARYGLLIDFYYCTVCHTCELATAATCSFQCF